MTRKDYVLIAEAFKDAFKEIDMMYLTGEEHDELSEGLSVGIESVADALARDNRRFDRDRFIKATGVKD